MARCGIVQAQENPPERMPSSSPESDPSGLRVGGVDLEKVELIRSPDLEQSPKYRSLTRQLDSSQQVHETLKRRGMVPLERRLREVLDRGVVRGRLEGALVASREGLVVAESSNIPHTELLACLGADLGELEQRWHAIPEMEGPVTVRLETQDGRMVLWHRLPSSCCECVVLAVRLRPCVGSQLTGAWARRLIQPIDQSIQDWMGRRSLEAMARDCSRILEEALETGDAGLSPAEPQS